MVVSLEHELASDSEARVHTGFQHRPCYRIESSLPILEFSIPSQSVLDGKPALTQGRLYAYAYQDHPALRTWYEALARWLRKSFKKNPIHWMSGYVGPSA